MNTIQSNWESFKTEVMHPESPAAQKREMKIAFYAGAGSLIKTLLNVADEDVSEEAGAELLQSLFEECRAFAFSEPN